MYVLICVRRLVLYRYHSDDVFSILLPYRYCSVVVFYEFGSFYEQSEKI